MHSDRDKHLEQVIRATLVASGHLLRDSRRAADLTQYQLSQGTSISKSTIARIETASIPNGPRLGTLDTLLKFCGQQLIAVVVDIQPPLADNKLRERSPDGCAL